MPTDPNPDKPFGALFRDGTVFESNAGRPDEADTF